MQANKSYKVGFLAVGSFIILYYGLLFLKGHNLFSKHNIYRVSYPTNKNLSIASVVKLKGHPVGRITKVELRPDQNYSTLVTMEVNKQFVITDKSKVLLSNAGMMGETALELELCEGKPLSKSDIITGAFHPDFKEIDLAAITAHVVTVAENIIKTAETVSESFIVLQQRLEKTSRALNSVIATTEHNITAVTKSFIDICTPLADSVQGIPAMASSLKNVLGEIEAIPFRKYSLKVGQVLNNVELLLQDASTTHGTLGLLLNDRALYTNLNSGAENINKLLIDFRNHPRKYVNFSLFGSCGQKEKKTKE